MIAFKCDFVFAYVNTLRDLSSLLRRLLGNIIFQERPRREKRKKKSTPTPEKKNGK
jgi:hypothetical protein